VDEQKKQALKVALTQIDKQFGKGSVMFLGDADDTHFMSLALQLARKGRYGVASNPMVGCVIVKDNKIIAKGYHQTFGKAKNLS
jgi:deoxycytidylate deaminase